MESKGKNIQILVDRAVEGSQIAFSQLLDKYWNDVYGFLLIRTQNEHDAEDLTIQTFSRAFDKIETYNKEFSFSTWLITISKNLHMDLLRKRKRNVLDDKEKGNLEDLLNLLDSNPGPEDALIIEQNLAALKRNLEQLNPRYSKVLQLRYFRGLSYAEIASELNEPLNSIKVKILRAKKLLAQIFLEDS